MAEAAISDSEHARQKRWNVNSGATIALGASISVAAATTETIAP
jgi:hypothetical protein